MPESFSICASRLARARPASVSRWSCFGDLLGVAHDEDRLLSAGGRGEREERRATRASGEELEVFMPPTIPDAPG